MKYVKIRNTNITAPAVALGCVHITRLDKAGAKAHIEKALELGVNFFDHADVYHKGACEELFGEAMDMNADKREKMIIQSKCGTADDIGYDFSRKRILSAVEGSLKRLRTDYLDILLLHRPDALMIPEEVAEAFNTLQSKGLVRYFGVSNQNPMQMELLQKYIGQKLVVNQMQLSVAYTPMIDTGLTVNMPIGQSVERTGSILEYCRLKDITIQAWSPFQYGFMEGVFVDSDKYLKLNEKLQELADKYDTNKSAIAVAWLLRHPMDLQVVLGTMNGKHLEDSVAGADVAINRTEWYEVYAAAGNFIP